MEDDELKTIFADFEPDMSPDFQFISKLEQRLDAVEIVRQQVAEARSRSRKAVAIASVVGFVVGFLFSLSLPYLSAAVASWQLTLPDSSAINMVADNFYLIFWTIVALTASMSTLNAYDLSVFLLRQKDKD